MPLLVGALVTLLICLLLMVWQQYAHDRYRVAMDEKLRASELRYQGLNTLARSLKSECEFASLKARDIQGLLLAVRQDYVSLMAEHQFWRDSVSDPDAMHEAWMTLPMHERCQRLAAAQANLQVTHGARVG